MIAERYNNMSNNLDPKKHPILSRFKMTDTANDMRDVLSGKGEFGVTYKLALVVGEGIFLAVILFSIFRLIISPFSKMTAVALIMALGYLLIFFV